MATKICSKCSLPKDEENDFYVDKRRGRPHPWCKGCYKLYRQAQVKADPAKHNAQCKAWDDAHPGNASVRVEAWRKRNLEKARNAVKRAKYNIDFPAVWEAQKGLCACCGGPMKPEGRDKDSVCVDHDRSCCPGQKSCGECVRGLVHWACNLILGYANDDPKILRYAAEYVERTRSQAPGPQGAEITSDPPPS